MAIKFISLFLNTSKHIYEYHFSTGGYCSCAYCSYWFSAVFLKWNLWSGGFTFMQKEEASDETRGGPNPPWPTCQMRQCKQRVSIPWALTLSPLNALHCFLQGSPRIRDSVHTAPTTITPVLFPVPRNSLTQPAWHSSTGTGSAVAAVHSSSPSVLWSSGPGVRGQAPLLWVSDSHSFSRKPLYNDDQSWLCWILDSIT